MSNKQTKRTRSVSPHSSGNSLLTRVTTSANNPSKKRRWTKPQLVLVERINEDPLEDTSPSMDELVEKILAFVAKHSDIQQCTTKWYALFATTIGGSEIPALLRRNKFMDYDTLIKKKKDAANLLGQNVPIPCLWGKLFEDILRAYAGILFDTKVYGSNICILDGQFRYSPDGLGVVTHHTQETSVKKIVLFEFKCPYTRIPKGDDIPHYYKPQVHAGLAATEEITQEGRYIEAVFRICSKGQLGPTPNFNRQYHSRDFTSYQKPVAWGLMNVYSKDMPQNETVVDYGNVNRDAFNEMLKNVDKGVLDTSLVYLKFEKGRPDSLFPQNSVNGMYLHGVIPFKMMLFYCIAVDPVPGFKQRVKAEIESFFKAVNKA